MCACERGFAWTRVRTQAHALTCLRVRAHAFVRAHVHVQACACARGWARMLVRACVHVCARVHVVGVHACVRACVRACMSTSQSRQTGMHLESDLRMSMAVRQRPECSAEPGTDRSSTSSVAWPTHACRHQPLSHNPEQSTDKRRHEPPRVGDLLRVWVLQAWVVCTSQSQAKSGRYSNDFRCPIATDSTGRSTTKNYLNGQTTK